MSSRLGRLGVVGLGLLGGSVALAARERGLAEEVRAVDPHVADGRGVELLPLPELAAWADLLVLAVPLAALEEVVRGLAPHLRADCLVTDVASLKRPLARLAQIHLGAPERCVGAHPMAGSHRSGLAAASAGLFEGAPCFIAPAGSADPAAVDRVEEFWQCLGAFTVRRTPEEHDALCAVLSHAPHLIAFAFARGLPDGEALRLAGPGLRDFIRIARADSGLWCDILLANRDRVAEEVARFRVNLDGMADALARGDRKALTEAIEESRFRSADLDPVDPTQGKA